MPRLRVEPNGVEMTVPKDLPLIAALWRCGVAIETPCGGFGICGKCKVQFTSGVAPPLTPEEKGRLSPAEQGEGWRLACRQRVRDDGALFVPPESRPAIVEVLTEALERPVPLEPSVCSVPVRVPPPSVGDERADLQRLLEGLRQKHGVFLPPSSFPLSLIRSLPSLLRRAGFTVHVVLHLGEGEGVPPRLLAVSEMSCPVLGLALDVGTTTLVGYLVDLTTGKELAFGARLNPQVQFGDDVVSRLCFALQEPNGSRQLQRAVVQGINAIIAECCQRAKVAPKDIYDVVVVGNTVMLHLLFGVDPGPIALAPYVPVFTDPMVVEAWRLGLRVHPNALVTTLPCVAGYLGADTVAVVLTHLWDPEGEPAVALDIGTNGEVVVRAKGRYFCGAAAAGPAFEGGRIRQGMRAERGAIAHITLERSDNRRWLHIQTVGGAPPKGLCGSGLIDAIAALLDAGVIDGSGRLCPERAPSEWRQNFRPFDDQTAFQLVHPEVAGVDEGVFLTQRDIRELQLAKGSIRAVTEVLLKAAGLRREAVQSWYIAGAFGMFVHLPSAQRIGLIPPIPLGCVKAVGNAAGAGAKLALRSRKERKRAKELALRMEHVSMAGNPDYEEALMAFIGFP